MGSRPCHISVLDLWLMIVQESGNEVAGQICSLEVKQALWQLLLDVIGGWTLFNLWYQDRDL